MDPSMQTTVMKVDWIDDNYRSLIGLSSSKLMISPIGSLRSVSHSCATAMMLLLILSIMLAIDPLAG